MRVAIRYSEAFKSQVLRELESGKFASAAVAARTYGLSAGGTIRYWARKYGKTHLLGKVVRVETPKEISELKELRKRVRELEKKLDTAEKTIEVKELLATYEEFRRKGSKKNRSTRKKR